MKKHKHIQFVLSVSLVILASFICYLISDFVGYRTIALVLLFVVSVAAILFEVTPVLVAAILSALIWDFFFIPPHFTFHVEQAEDALMLIMYFIIALVNGVLTTRIRKIEKLSQMKEEKINSIKLYNTLFNSISHELKTPISTIYGSADNLLNNKENLSEENKLKLIVEIHKATERLNRLVSNLLSMSRLETGYINLKKDWCNVDELITSVINSLEEPLRKHTVKKSIDEQFPLVKLDFGLMETAINNIVFNAAVHTPENSQITFELAMEGNLLKIIISDNGKGLMPDEIDKIFDKFYRINSSVNFGTGLGLSIAKGFVEAHKGKIKAFNNGAGGLSVQIDILLQDNEIMNINSLENE